MKDLTGKSWEESQLYIIECMEGSKRDLHALQEDIGYIKPIVYNNKTKVNETHEFVKQIRKLLWAVLTSLLIGAIAKLIWNS